MSTHPSSVDRHFIRFHLKTSKASAINKAKFDNSSTFEKTKRPIIVVNRTNSVGQHYNQIIQTDYNPFIFVILK